MCASKRFVVIASILFLLQPVEASPRKDEIRISCSQSGKDCLSKLAKSVVDNPEVSRFYVGYRESVGEFAVANSIMETFIEHNWYYSRKAETLDYLRYHFIPPDDHGKMIRTKFCGLSSRLFESLSKEAFLDTDFQKIAVRNGAKFVEFFNRLSGSGKN